MGIGFAIPINMVKNIQEQLQGNGKVTRGWLGVVIQNVDENLAQSFGLDTAEGILVSEVQAGSPAEKSGVKQGDVILKLNGTVLRDVADLRNRVALLTPESDAELDMVRDGKNTTITVKIGERPTTPNQVGGQKNNDSSLEQFGLTFQQLTPELAEQLGYQESKGVVVSQVQPGSPAESAGMQPGQLIEEVNKQRVTSLSEMQSAVAGNKNQNRLLLRVRSGNYSQYVVLIAK
jgi:serine protease Do